MMRTLFSVPVILVLVGCQRPPSEPSEPLPPTPAPTSEPGPAQVGPDDAGTSASDDAAAAPAGKQPVARWTEGLKTPESVLYDAERDRYLVSNINGRPVDVDNNGFISELSPDGEVKNLHFIAGGKAESTGSATSGKADAGPASQPAGAAAKLDAPKGMAISGGVLYVADLTQVRMFDAVTGAPKGEVKIPGTTFLNDVAAAPDGKLYVADSGLKMGASGFEPTGTDAVYVIEKGKAKPVARSKELDRPNGLLWTKDGLIVTTFGTTGIYLLDAKGAMQNKTALPKGSLDGIVSLGDELLVSSWDAKTVFRGKLGGRFTPVIEGVESPADIGFDTKRSRVLVPRFMANAVEAYALE